VLQQNKFCFGIQRKQKTQIVLLITFLLFPLFIFAGGKNNPDIDSLVRASDAVILEEHINFSIMDQDNAEYSYKERMLIKNSKADDYCRIILTETEFVKLDDIQATLYDTSGNIIKTLDKNDIKSVEIKPGYKYYSEEKYKWFTLSTNQYPFILEYRFKLKINSLFFWPNWYPQSSIPNLSGSYSLDINKDIKFRYLEKGSDIKLNQDSSGNRLKYVWNVKNLPAKTNEDNMPPEDKVQTAVYFSPDSFSLRDYTGKFNSWTAVGNWYKNLSDGRYQLPSKGITELRSLLLNVTDPREKIEKIYQYLQKNNRYVSIELGIAGWQPQSASDVYKNHYGDCKDLTTLMVSMLTEAGIKSYPALALTRDEGVVNSNFPSNQFNHCIAFVPLRNDTLWIECTGQFMDLGDMPSEIEGIQALVVEDQSAELIKTPIKSSANNLWVSTFRGNLTNTGDLIFNAKLSTTGNQKEFYKASFGYKNNEEDLEFLKKIFTKYYSVLNIQRYSLNDSNSNNFEIDAVGIYNGFMSQTGRLVFINPNILNRKIPDDLPKEEAGKRIFPVYNEYPYVDIDTVEINLPETYTMQSKPVDKTINKDFGSYSLHTEIKGNDLIFVRKIVVDKREIPVKSYQEYKDFLKEIITMDNTPIVFKRSAL
jgi:hypothetical protein